MSDSYLKKLEELFLEACDLETTLARQSFVDQISKSDPTLAAELRNLLSARHESGELFQVSCDDYVSILYTTLGEPKRTESKEELLQFLNTFAPPKNNQFLATLQHFDLLELVAAGATGFVFRARDTSLNREVAVKVLAPSIAANRERKESFVAEARLASSIPCSNVVTIHHTYFDPSRPLAFYVMEWISGMTLQSWIDQNTNASRAAVDSLFDQMTQGVIAIHKRGIIHRDLKPGNMMIEEGSNRLVIVDFGLALDSGYESGTGFPVGTPLYMSPEQFQGQPLTFASDLFSLAEITCLLFTGLHPFDSTYLSELSKMVLSGKPVVAADGKINALERNTLITSLQVDPSARQASVREFYEQFKEAAGTVTQENKPIVFLAPPNSPRWLRLAGKTKWVAPALVVFLLIVGYGMSNYLDWPESRNDANSQAANPLGKGAWLDTEHFRNFVGMKLRWFTMNRPPIQSWPPFPEHPELFTNLGWRNETSETSGNLIGTNMVTNAQFKKVMGHLPPVEPDCDQNPDDPVTNLSLEEANAFCEKLTRVDPDGLKYFVCSHNAWTFAAYGHALLHGSYSPQDLIDWHRNKSEGTAVAPPNFSLINDVYTDRWEWSRFPKVNPGFNSTFFPQDDRKAIRGGEYVELLGGATSDIFLHVFDAYDGMTDHLVERENLVFHCEEDGTTCYLHPQLPGKKATLTYRYFLDHEIISARFWDPIFIFEEQASGGVQVRFSSSAEPDLSEKPWINVITYAGINVPPEKRVDITPIVRQAVTLELRFWVESEQRDLKRVQIGRMDSIRKVEPAEFGPESSMFFGLEAITKGRGESPRQVVAVPKSFRSPYVSFRIMASPEVAVMANRPSN